MFGYIRPDTPMLLVYENEQYKGVYCSLCKAIGKNYGFLSRMSLSYDYTFLSLLLLNENKACTGFKDGRCTYNPLKKCKYLKSDMEVLKLPAALSVLSMREKLIDNIQDGSAVKKIGYRFLLLLSRRSYRKAKKDFPVLADILSKMTEQQQKTESNDNPGLDICAEPTAVMLSEVFRQITGNENKQRIYKTMGYYFGKWIYLIDAGDDLPKDLKDGSFNPLIHLFQLTPESSHEDIQKARLECNKSLNMYSAQIAACINLIDENQFIPIIQNIVEKGMPEMQHAKLFTEEESHV